MALTELWKDAFGPCAGPDYLGDPRQDRMQLETYGHEWVQPN